MDPMTNYDPDTATVRQQWADLRRAARNRRAEEVLRLSMRWPAIEVRHERTGGGWWDPTTIVACANGRNWRKVI